LIEMDYSSDKTADKKDEAGPCLAAKKPIPASTLHPRIQALVSKICDMDMMKKHMEEVGYDSKKMPLGKLSKETITKGYQALQDISKVLEHCGTHVGSKARDELLELSGVFYTAIPHDFGFSKMIEHNIDSAAKLKKKLLMVEALGDIVLAHKVLAAEEEDETDPFNPVDMSYSKLKCDMAVYQKGSPEFALCEEYLQSTHADTHSTFKMELECVFSLEREGEATRYQKFEKLHNRQMLWHGSRLTNWAGILSQGLRIAPPEAPVTGYMFDKGVYFADMSSKSANYCFTNTTNNVGMVMLAEVALGDMQEMKAADYHAATVCRKAKKHSVKGLGRTAPDPKACKLLENGCTVPTGKGTATGVKDSSLLYNEYIVYDISQVKMKYLLQVKFKYDIHSAF